MPAFLRLLLQAVLLRAVLLLQAVLILANRRLAFMMMRPRMPSLIILVVAIVPLPKLPAMVAQPLLALVPTVVLERELAEIPVPPHPSVSSSATLVMS